MDKIKADNDPSVQEIRRISDQNTKEVCLRSGSVRNYYKSHVNSGPGITHQDENHSEESSALYFFTKVLICILLFAGFCFMNLDDRTLGQYDSQKIQQIVQTDMQWKDLQEINTFFIINTK